jgi:uncharacterized protein
MGPSAQNSVTYLHKDAMAAPASLLGNLAAMTLRQLRQIAADIGVALYGGKSRQELVDAIASRGEGGAGGEPGLTLQAMEAAMAAAPRPAVDRTRVTFLPRDPQWAYVFWEISPADRQAALAAGAGALCLRVADVTGLDGGSAHPHTLQEVVVDSHASEWYLPMPLSDREYRVELGYRTGAAGGWFGLAFSSVARMPALHPSEQILDQFVPFSLDSIPVRTDLAAIEPAALPLGELHERMYQTASRGLGRRSLGIGSEAFQEQGRAAETEAAAGQSSGVGLWASGRNASGRGGVAPRQRSFWLVADAELIVYGATEPSARLSIGGEPVPLDADGTFRIQVPFRDGEQLYPIEAVAADGEQKRSITMNFNRSTPEARVNSKEAAVAEWF